MAHGLGIRAGLPGVGHQRPACLCLHRKTHGPTRYRARGSRLPSQDQCAGKLTALLSRTGTSHTEDWALSPSLLLSLKQPPAPRSSAQHRPAGPAPPLLPLPPVPLPLCPLPLGGLPLGARACCAPALPDLPSLGSRGPVPFCGSEHIRPSSSASGSLRPRGCWEPSGQAAGFSWAPGLGLRTHGFSPGPGLPAPPRERSRGTKSVCCGELGAGLLVEAPDFSSGRSGGAGAGLVAGVLPSLPGWAPLCLSGCSSALTAFLVLWPASWLSSSSAASSFVSHLRALPVSLSLPRALLPVAGAAEGLLGCPPRPFPSGDNGGGCSFRWLLGPRLPPALAGPSSLGLPPSCSPVHLCAEPRGPGPPARAPASTERNPSPPLGAL